MTIAGEEVGEQTLGKSQHVCGERERWEASGSNIFDQAGRVHFVQMWRFTWAKSRNCFNTVMGRKTEHMSADAGSAYVVGVDLGVHL